jgi:tRNA(Ile)-lysidine synthase
VDRPDPTVGGLNPEVVDLAARCPFPPPGTPVTCAVSGGADSLALLALAVAAGCTPTAVHVDHGLRPGSDTEAGVVAAAAHRLGAGFRAVTVAVTAGPNLEARARQARYDALPADVLTGHTADDRAETVLLHLLRGAGITGLAALAPGPRRPLAGLRRADTERVCALLGLEVVHDPSNLDPVHRRNRVRHELLPLAADIAGRDLVPVLTRQADLLGELDAWVVDLAARIDPTSAADLGSAPTPVARVAVRRWLVEAGVGDGYVVDAASVDRVLAVARGTVVATEVAGGWRVARSRNHLHLHRPAGS